MTTQQHGLAAKMYRHGWTTQEIADELKVSRSEIVRTLRNQRVKMRARGQRIERIPLSVKLNGVTEPKHEIISAPKPVQLKPRGFIVVDAEILRQGIAQAIADATIITNV